MRQLQTSCDEKWELLDQMERIQGQVQEAWWDIRGKVGEGGQRKVDITLRDVRCYCQYPLWGRIRPTGRPVLLFRRVVLF